MKAVLLVNAGAGKLAVGTSTTKAEILSACRTHEIDATVEICDPRRLSTTARRRAEQGAGTVVAVGGDGTVSAVAAGLVDTGVPLGVLPLGTLNHFSKDLGILDVEAAFEALAEAHTTRVDVGEVNGHVFINNSSLGVYPEFILERDRERHRTGVRRWGTAMLGAARRLLRRYELEVTIALPDACNVTTAFTPFVLVGNNRYARELRAFGKRERLDGGILSVYTMHATTRSQLFRALFDAILRRKNPPELEEHEVPRAVIKTSKRALKVAVDGEVIVLDSPLEYRSRAGALVVIAPKHRRETRFDETARPHLRPSLRQTSSDDRPRSPR